MTKKQHTIKIKIGRSLQKKSKKSKKNDAIKTAIIFDNYINFKIKDKFPFVKFFKLLSEELHKRHYNIQIIKDNHVATIKKLLADGVNIGLILIMDDFYMLNTNNSIGDDYKFFQSLNKNIIIYPPPKLNYYTNSKSYLFDIPESLKIYNSLVIKYVDNNSFKTKFETFINTSLEKYNTMVVKIAFSANGENLFFIDTDNINICQKIYTLLSYQYKKHNIPINVIIEPYNNIISNRENEYRTWFFNGKFIGHFCFGIIKKNNSIIKLLNNIKYNKNNEIHKNVLNCAMKIYNIILKKIRILLNDYKFIPIALRFDISYYINNGKKIYYCNEIENIDGTFYFNLPISLNNKLYHTLESQYFLAETIASYIDNY